MNIKIPINSLQNNQIALKTENKSVMGKEIDSYSWPPIWDVPVNTGTFAYVKIESEANPRIDGISLVEGDYIGCFYTGSTGEYKCAGAGRWGTVGGIWGVLYGIFGNDAYTPEKDGFAYNEIINFKFWKRNTNTEYLVPRNQITYTSCVGCNTSGKYNGLGIHKVINIYV